MSACFSAGVGATCIVRSVFGKLCRIVEFQVAVNFICADMMKALAVLADGFKDSCRTDEVGLNEWPWVAEAIVVMALGCKVNDNISIADKAIHKFFVTDITSNEIDLIED